jgi:hypothetical protein
MSSYDCSKMSATSSTTRMISSSHKIDAHSNAALVGVSGYSTARCGITDVILNNFYKDLKNLYYFSYSLLKNKINDQLRSLRRDVERKDKLIKELGSIK